MSKFGLGLDLISEKVARWVYIISKFDVKIQFLPSICGTGDQLSRMGDGGDGEDMPMAKNVKKKKEEKAERSE